MHWIVLCCTLCGNWALGRLKHLWCFQSFFNGWCLIWKGIFTCSRVFPLAPGVSMAITVEMQKGENTRLFAFSKSLNKRLPNVFTPFVTNREGGRGFVLFSLVIISFTWDSDILGQSSAACIGLEWNIYESNVLSVISWMCTNKFLLCYFKLINARRMTRIVFNAVAIEKNWSFDVLIWCRKGSNYSNQDVILPCSVWIRVVHAVA